MSLAQFFQKFTLILTGAFHSVSYWLEVTFLNAFTVLQLTFSVKLNLLIFSASILWVWQEEDCPTCKCYQELTSLFFAAVKMQSGLTISYWLATFLFLYRLLNKCSGISSSKLKQMAQCWCRDWFRATDP